MKKIIFSAVTVLFAAHLQAATISWGSDCSTFLVDSNGNIATTDMGYNYVLAMVGNTTDGINYNNAIVRGTGEFQYDSGMNMIGGGYKAVLGTDIDGMIYAVMAQDKTTGDLLQLMYVDGTSAQNPIETYTLSGFKEDASQLAGFNVGNSGNFTAAPEPTSGLLVLMGLAGLMLRRKRA